jgi:predicted lipid-binding transport protein (Tim44 family)
MIEIIILAAVAGFLFLRLRDVLGTRTGHDNPEDYFGNRRPGAEPEGGEADKVVQFPGRDAGAQPLPDDHSDIATVTDLEGPAGRTLVAAKAVEPDFNAVRFIEGARAAYEMILMAFETGDKDTLRPLLAADVMESFEEAIDQRTEQGLSVDARFIGLRSSKISDARLDEATDTLQVDVRFDAEMIVAVRNADGEIVDGDPEAVRRMNDFWTFERKLGTDDPSWILVETGD